MISNFYTWIFPAALFAAAGLSNLSSSVKGKRNPSRAHSNRVVWFSLNISIALCFLTGSVFFVNWSQIDWSVTYLYFSLAVLIIFYLGFIFKYIIGLFIIFIFAFIVLFFNIYLQNWKEIPPGGIISTFRILSSDQDGLKAEISGLGASPLFIEGEGSFITINYNVLELDKVIFFINSDIYYREMYSLSKTGFSESIVNLLARKSFLVSQNTYSINIEDNALLYEYSIILDRDRKKIYIEN